MKKKIHNESEMVNAVKALESGVTDFPSGIYLISIMTSQNQYIKKIIKL